MKSTILSLLLGLVLGGSILGNIGVSYDYFSGNLEVHYYDYSGFEKRLNVDR